MKLHFSRREFLKQSALAIAAFDLSIPEAPSAKLGGLPRTDTPKKVLVAGAGLAGLSAAYELTQAGHEVTVLEARSYAGGRVFTLRDPFADGLHAEAGAARIPLNHELTIKYVRLFNLTLLPFYSTEPGFVRYQRGKRKIVKWGDFAGFVEKQVGVRLGNGNHWFEIQGGNDLLPRAFAARLTGKILYNAPVTKIEHDAQGVRVVFSRGGSVETMTADYLVCAIPFSILRQIEVAPRFSPLRTKIIEQMSYDSVSRIFLQCRRRFWAEQKLNGFAITDRPAEIWHATSNQPGARGILQSYLRHSVAQRLMQLPESERIRLEVEALEQVFPGTREHLETSAAKHWGEDEWVRGGWAHPTDEQLQHNWQPEGHVHFAGEHTSALFSWMQGALESGNRAAREVHEAAHSN